MEWALLTLAIINTILLIAGLIQLWRIKKLMSTHETELQTALGILRDVVSPGVTAIIEKLDALPVDNPALQDEIDGVKSVAQEMADKINAKLNPPAPPEPTE